MVAGTPVLASRIKGNVGLLGEAYPGYFDVGDTRELARLMLRAESDAEFPAELRSHCEDLAPLFTPEREAETWRCLLAGLLTRCRL